MTGRRRRGPLGGQTFADLLGKDWASLTTYVVLALLTAISEAAVLAITAQVAASLATETHSVHVSMGPLHLNTSITPLLEAAGVAALFRLALQYPLAVIPSRIGANVLATIRRDLLGAFMAASWATQAADREGHFQELMGNQIQQCIQATVQATLLLLTGGEAVILLVAALVLDPPATGSVLVVAIALLAMLRPLSAAGKRAATRWSQAELEHAANISEASRLAEETHVFGVGDAQRAHIDDFITHSRRQYVDTQVILRFLPGTFQSLIYLLLVGGLLLVDKVAHHGIASLGAVVLLLVRAASYGNTAQRYFEGVRQSLPFVRNVRAAEAAYRASTPPRGDVPLAEIKSVAFNDVSYAYTPDRVALNGVTFEVHEGEAIGIAGPSGGGKSTLAQILLQLREPSAGQYLVNGVPAAQYREQDWSRLIAYVPQTPHLIHASVADNIRYYRDISDADVRRAAELAGISGDIASWPDGFDTLVGPRANAVSGGQAQRLCIARAIAGRPKMLLLDEPTSAVDLKSEQLIQQSLLSLKGEVTLFIIAHRISTLDMCDRVMVILDGQVDEFGPYSQLRKNNAYYRAVSALADEQQPAATPTDAVS